MAEDWYLWYDELATVNSANFDSASALLAALTAPLAEDFRDPGFSYLTTAAEDEANFTSRAFVGFGFRFVVDEAGRYLISDVFETGAAFAAGFVRGAEILAVNAGTGFVTMREYEEQGTSIDEIFGPSELGLERGFRLLVDGETTEIVVTKAELDVPPLATAPRQLDRPGLSPVGYIHLRNFTLSANDELDAAFSEFAAQGITDFIVDLRYNGGGLVSVAENFLDLLGGEIARGDVAYRMSHNEKRAAENFDYAFVQQSNSASPLRIAFITSESTASASELLINSLTPYVELALIGSDTLGKSVGQYAFDQTGCDTRLRIVAFETVNADGLGGFYTGLADTGRFTLCAVDDVYTGAFGSSEEALTQAAMAWLGEGTCPISPNSATSRGLRRVNSISAPERADRRSLWEQ